MSYIVAQKDDEVRVGYDADSESERFGQIGRVVDQRPIRRPSVTARECLVLFGDGNSEWISADDLTVVWSF